MGTSIYADLATAVARLGLTLRGGFRPTADDGLDDVGAVVMVGHTGRSLWPVFETAHQGGPDPLDRWVRGHLTTIAEPLDAAVVTPNDGPPYRPFQRWAQRAAGLHQSPLGLLIDPEFGLWHALRAAILSRDPLDLPPRPETASPCDSCTDRPCLSACPVDAFSEAGYDAARSRAHVASAAGADCRTGGCLARRACPIGAEHAYEDAQQAFHMASFIGAGD